MAKLTKYDEVEDRYYLVEEPDPSYTYSYADYLQWKFRERLELIRGRIFKLSAPNTKHQVVCGNVFAHLYYFLKKEQCQVFVSPFDVRLPRKNKTGDNEITTVVQPDVCVVCDENKIDARGCCGAPDLVVEILSPGNSNHEVRTKFQLYQEAGIPEYWLVNPEEENLVVYLLNEEGVYTNGAMYAGEDSITSVAVKGFTIPVKDIFAR